LPAVASAKAGLLNALRASVGKPTSLRLCFRPSPFPPPPDSALNARGVCRSLQSYVWRATIAGRTTPPTVPATATKSPTAVVARSRWPAIGTKRTRPPFVALTWPFHSDRTTGPAGRSTRTGSGGPHQRAAAELKVFSARASSDDHPPAFSWPHPAMMYVLEER
jgi:hypothetical protein